MKKIVVLLAFLVVLLAGVYANGRGEMTTVEGTLAVRDSLPVVETADGVWLLPPGAFYRIAWENKISVGDRVVIRGYTDSDRRIDSDDFTGRIMPVSVTVNGRELDISGTVRPGLRRGGRGDYGDWCGSFEGRGPRDGERFRDGELSGNRGRNR